MSNEMLKLFSAFAVACVLATSANAAQISLVNTSSAAFTPGDTGPTSLNAGSYSMTTGNALVVSAAVRHGGGGTGIDATFAGQMPDYSFIEESGDRAGVGTFLFLNPVTTTGDIVVDLGTGARAGVVAYELSDVGGVFDAQAFSENGNGDTTANVSYDGPAGGYLVATLSGEGPGAAPSITGDNIDVTPMMHANGDNGRFITAWSAGGEIAAAGTGFTTTNAYYRAGAMSSVALYAVPEPSSLVLLGLSGLVLSALRRR